MSHSYRCGTLSTACLMKKSFYTLEQIAKTTSCTLEGDPGFKIFGFSDLEAAQSQDVTFLNKNNSKQLELSSAGAIFLTPNSERPQGRNYLLCENPEKAFIEAIKLLGAKAEETTGFPNIHPTAVIHPTAKIGNTVTVGPFVVIEQGAVIGDDVIIGASAFIGVNVQVGSGSTIHPQVTIQHNCKIGSRVILHPGAVIGTTGFGYQQDKEGRHILHQHFGNVVIEDDVEIGANTTIDRGRYGKTWIRRGTKIDNQVQIAHNVEIGEDNILVSQVGIAGSSKTGRWVVLAGKVAVNDHIKIVDRVIVAACSAVSKSILKSGTYSGMPTFPITEHNRRQIHLRNIERLVKRVDTLEKR